jgi:hypothetical protein
MATKRVNKSATARSRQLSGLKHGGPGRPKGVPNKATVEVKEAARGLVEDATYRQNLKTRLETGKLAPAMESVLWFYAYGKPKETVAIEHSVRDMNDDELKAYAAGLVGRL